MGEKYFYQPLTRRDAITVVLYRAGIALSTVCLSALAVGLYVKPHSAGLLFTIALSMLYLSTGLSVFFIHLYIGKFKRALKRLYIVSLFSLAALFVLGGGDLLRAVTGGHYGPLFLLPLSGCLGFVAAKEAFCFRLYEGYLLAVLMPFYLLLLSTGLMTDEGTAFLFSAIALMSAFFTLRKVFQPVHYDIGDKSAYQP